eukprot:scaffold34207_cov34-Prasinocladus_malaysianus.AAC.1
MGSLQSHLARCFLKGHKLAQLDDLREDGNSDILQLYNGSHVDVCTDSDWIENVAASTSYALNWNKTGLIEFDLMILRGRQTSGMCTPV